MMKGIIRRLDAVTIGQIAAGEVIERPVSVIKELVENALDAGAKRISVHVRGGGIEEIEVVDDGGGISPEDLPVALERHATSKLRDTHDLEAVMTLGFRGEGLASIAAVARTTVSSRRSQDDLASKVEAFEDFISPVELSPGPVGTRINVRDLFVNVPVRREYLRSAQAEATRISTFLSTLALGYPDVSFHLRIDGREAFRMPPARSGMDRLAHVFGRDVYDRMIEIKDVATGMHGTVRGFISRPGADRGDRRQQLLFVNGRLLRSTQLAGAWTAAYTGYTLVGRHAYGVLMIDLPPDHLDPNVHPTKSDVRFRYAAQVCDAVKTAIVTTLARDARDRLGKAISPSPSSLPQGASRSYSLTGALLDEPREKKLETIPAVTGETEPSRTAPERKWRNAESPTPKNTAVRAKSSAAASTAAPGRDAAILLSPRSGAAEDTAHAPVAPDANSDNRPNHETLDGTPRMALPGADAVSVVVEEIAPPADAPVPVQNVISPSASWQNARRLAGAKKPEELRLIEAPSARLRVLAQLDRAFILATDGRGIVLVDQHAAHERVAYEAICASALGADTEGLTATQPLLVPELIEVPQAEVEMLEASIDALAAAGVEIERFGERVYRLTAMPAMLAKRRFHVLSYLDDLDEETPDLDARERVWATMACHSVVRAGEAMEIQEMQMVVDRLALCANPMHCPHGRPTLVRFDAPQIAKFFRR